MNEDLAFRRCEEVTRTRAKNFYYGIRLLPGSKRRALCAVYAFARRMDDIGDGSLPDEEKLRHLAAARRSLEETSPDAADPVLAALGHARARFAIPLDAFGDLIDGIAMDVGGATYDTFTDLEVYCRRVAGSIGRLSVGVFGAADPAAMPLADDLGVAMQLTNILRDVREDLGRGRVYLPREDLDRFGCGVDLATASPEAIGELARFEVGRARSWFERGRQLLPLLDPRSGSCVSAMTGIYRLILDRIERHPQAVLRDRISLAPWEKAWVAVRSLAEAVAVRSLLAGSRSERRSSLPNVTHHRRSGSQVGR
ncbi:MAG: presqualene diphosphate synthase HpnD [Actinomycetota bacterium]